MSSVGLSGLSNISSDTLQGRYEKALKQINKLIEINRELKERLGENQQEVLLLQGQVSALQQANRELDEESNILDAKYMELNSHYEQL
jgi:predicted nuclease with TOPRIM domain